MADIFSNKMQLQSNALGGILNALAQIKQKQEQDRKEQEAQQQIQSALFQNVPAQFDSVPSNANVPSAMPQMPSNPVIGGQMQPMGFAGTPRQTVQTAPASTQFNPDMGKILALLANKNTAEPTSRMLGGIKSAMELRPQVEQTDPYKDTFERNPITGERKQIGTAQNKPVTPTNKETIPTGKTRTDGGMVMREVIDRDPNTLQPVGSPRWEPWQQQSQNAQIALQPVDEKLASAIAQYDVPLTSVGSLRGNRREAILSKVLEINPQFDMTNYATKQGLKRDFSTGKSAQNIRSLNTAIGHLGQLAEASDALQNGNVTVLNKLANTYKSQTGKSAPAVFNSVKTAVAGELGTTFKGTGATDQEIRQLMETINAAQSPQQVKDVVRTYAELLNSRLQALDEQYRSNIGGGDNFKVLNKHSEEVLKKINPKSSGLTEKDIDNMSEEELKKFLEGK